MTDRKQSAFARRYASNNIVSLRTTSENQDQSLQLQTSDLVNLYTSLEAYSKITRGELEVLSSVVYSLTPILNIDQINFNLIPASTTVLQGQVLWNAEYSTLTLGLNDTVFSSLGQTMHKRIRNNTGSTITKGQVLYVTGAHGATNITVGLADASTEATAATTIGIAAENISNNTEGFIITQGYLRGITTNHLSGSEGSMIWLSETTGEFTSTRPTQPAHGVHLGWLVKKAGGGAGSIYVHITNGLELYEIHDVLITSPTNGQVLTYNSITGLWTNQTPGGAALLNSVNTSIDFGSNSNETTTEVVVTGQTWVTSTSNIQIRPNLTQTHGHTLEDYLLERIQCLVTKLVVGVGFTIQAYAPNGTSGIYDIIAYEA